MVYKILSITKNNGVTYTLINDSWNAMGISMLEGIKVLKTKSRFIKVKLLRF